MLTIFSVELQAPQLWAPGAASVTAPVWLDLIEPSQEERDEATRLLGTTLPTRDQTSALELSNRLRASEKVLRLNIPSFVRTEGEQGPSTPLGFVLTPTMLASVRYAESLAFNQVAQDIAQLKPESGADVLIGLLQRIVNVGADRIEVIAGDLSRLSQAVFVERRSHHRLLRSALFEVGRMQRQIVQIRSGLLGVSRIVIYLCDVAPAWIDPQLQAQFKVIQADITSLNEFDQQMSDRLQFLLDAVLGFINNQQNDIMRVLTIVSVATVPPVILAGIWGMNFKSIPEYDWPHGYAFGLSMIVLSTILPLLWFKSKKWL